LARTFTATCWSATCTRRHVPSLPAGPTCRRASSTPRPPPAARPRSAAALPAPGLPGRVLSGARALLHHRAGHRPAALTGHDAARVGRPGVGGPARPEHPRRAVRPRSAGRKISFTGPRPSAGRSVPRAAGHGRRSRWN
jgi:hypothetical protein